MSPGWAGTRARCLSKHSSPRTRIVEKRNHTSRRVKLFTREKLATGGELTNQLVLDAEIQPSDCRKVSLLADWGQGPGMCDFNPPQKGTQAPTKSVQVIAPVVMKYNAVWEKGYTQVPC